MVPLAEQKLVVIRKCLDRLLQFLIIPHQRRTSHALAAQAELCVCRPGSSRERQLVPFAARAFRAASCMIADRTLQQ